MSGSDIGALEASNVQVIEWHMLNKSKFLPLSLASVLSMRVVLYPLIVVKTRVQVHYGDSRYKNAISAFRTICKHEGWKALYRGFLVNSCQVKQGTF